MIRAAHFFVLSFIVVQVVGCAAVPSPAVRAFGDNKFWALVEDLPYEIGNTGDKIIVPKGFVMDFASIPPKLCSFGLSPMGQYSRAAIVHDYLYWSQGCTRKQADRLMLIAMKESKVVKFIRKKVIYNAVKEFGEDSWIKNAKERQAGFPRILPANYDPPADPNVHWPIYRAMLRQKGFMDPDKVFKKNPSYCKYGNSETSPKLSFWSRIKQFF